MKTVFTFVILTLFTYPLAAQGKKHEINIGLGLASRPYLKEIIKIDKIGRVGYGGDDNSSIPALNFNYRYLINKSFNIGATFIFEQQKHSLTSSVPPFENYSRYKERYYTILLHGNYVWVKKFFQLYSGLSAGINIRTREETYYFYAPMQETTKVLFAYQITPLGIRIGKKTGGFAELGYGYKGILCCGLSYRF